VYEIKLASKIDLPYFRTLVNIHVRNRTVSDRFGYSVSLLDPLLNSRKANLGLVALMVIFDLATLGAEVKSPARFRAFEEKLMLDFTSLV